MTGASTNTRAALYIRVSTEEQAVEGWSIDAQERALRSYCQLKDWQVVSIFKDEGRTGTNTDRPGFQEMLQAAKGRTFDTVVVHKLDRFSRNLEDVMRILGELEKYSVTFVSATEANMDFTTPYGRMMLGFMGTMSQWYVDNLRNETTKGKRERFEQGFYNGDLRFGYSKGDDGKPTPNDDAEGVRLAFTWCSQGKTDGEIATLLNVAGYRTYRLIGNYKKKAGPDDDPKTRRPWTKDSVASMLRAGPFYMGNTRYVGKVEQKQFNRHLKRGEQYTMQVQEKKGTHGAIITEELNDRATAARSARTNAGRVPNTRERVYLMSGGMAICITCGLPLRCTNSGKNKRLLYYQCPAHYRGMKCDASRQKIREEKMLLDIERMIALLVLPDNWRDRTRELLDTAPTDIELTNAERRNSDITETLRRLAYQYQLGLISDQELARDVAPLKTEQQKLIAKLKVIVPQEVEAQGEQLIKFTSSWMKASKAQKHEMLFVAIYVDVNKGAIDSFEPHPDFKVLFMQTAMIEREGRFYLPDAMNERECVANPA